MNAEEYTLRCMGDIWSALFERPEENPEPQQLLLPLDEPKNP
jgi:hypothetical protein